MIETKQLEYFVVCARLSSFSRAAEALYTTQPNVSKVIRTLEQELGFSLFIRQSRGIMLPSRGRRVYEYASKAVEQVEQLVSFARMDKGEELLASWNPSSWMASCFAAFYQEHSQEDVCYHVMTAGTEEILDRCKSGKDDIGFVYVSEDAVFPISTGVWKAGISGTEADEGISLFWKRTPAGWKAEYRRDSERPGAPGAVL